MENVDVNKPVENPNLVKLLKLRSEVGNDASKMNQLMNSILGEVATNAHFLAVIAMSPDAYTKTSEGEGVINEGATLSFQMIEAPDGSVYLPIFTDWPSLRAWEIYRDVQVSTLIMSFEDVCAVVTEKMGGAVINPFTDNLALGFPQLKHMLMVKNGQTQGHSQRVIEKETKVMIGDPAEYPTQMVEAIKSYAKTNKNIKAIYLRLMIENDQQSFLLVVDFKGDNDEVFGGISNAARSFIPAGKFISMVPLDSNLGKQAATNEPFYKRKGLFF